MSQKKTDLTRRNLLRGSAGAALTLAWGWHSLAFAGPGKAGPVKKGLHKVPSKKAASKPKPKAQAAPKKKNLVPAPTMGPLGSLSAQERAMGDAIAQKVKHGIAVASVRPVGERFATGSYASIGQKFVRGLGTKKRDAAGGNANKLLAAPMRTRQINFGRMAAAAASDHRRPLKLVPQKLVAAAKQTILTKKWTAQKVAPSQGLKKLPNPFTRVGFFLNEVKCVEETDEIGADQILMAGTGISPTGQIVKIRKITVSNDFDQGETKAYYPPGHSKFVPNDPYRGRTLAQFNLGEAGLPYPGSWTLSLVMGEEDSGGFSEMIEELWGAIAKEVKIALVVVSQHLGGYFGQVIAQIMGYVLDSIVGFLVQLFDNPDDLIDRDYGALTLPTPNDDFYLGLSGRDPHAPANVWASKRQTWKFKGDGGYYKAKLHWRVWR